MDVVLATTFTSPWVVKVPVALFADNFERPDASTLGKTQLGNLNWLLIGNSGVTVTGYISSGAAYVRGSTSGGRTFAYVNAGVSDGDFKFVAENIAANVSNSNVAGVFRFVDQDNHWQVVVVGTNWCLYRRTAGTATLVATLAANPVDGDQITVSLLGPRIRVYRNGAQVYENTNLPQFQTATRFGFQGAGTAIASPSRYREVSFDGILP